MTAVTSKIIELTYEDHDGRVRVVPENHDLMVLPVEEAIAACRAYSQQIEFNRQFNSLLDRLAGWIVAQQAGVAEAILTTREAGLLFLVVRSQPTYDREFEDSLTALDLEIANDNDFELIDLNVLSLPQVEEERVQSFLSKTALRLRKRNGK